MIWYVVILCNNSVIPVGSVDLDPTATRKDHGIKKDINNYRGILNQSLAQQFNIFYIFSELSDHGSNINVSLLKRVNLEFKPWHPNLKGNSGPAAGTIEPVINRTKVKGCVERTL